MQSQSTTQPISMLDSQTALALTETKEIIDDFVIQFCGLMYIQKGDKKHLIRTTKPKFTYEFVQDLMSNVYVEVNRITARTDYTELELKRFNLKQCNTMSEWFAIAGIQNLVSDRVWQHCLNLAKPDNLAEPFRDENNNLVKHNYWFTKYGIHWSYHQPFNTDMLNIIKRDYDLDDESFGQDIILRDIFWSVRIFIHGGLNRSKKHLTLDHEKVIHKESLVQTDSGQVLKSEGFVEKMKSGVKKIIG